MRPWLGYYPRRGPNRRYWRAASQPGAVTTDPGILRDRAIDSWALALLRRVRGDDLPVPAAVVFPACTEEVAAVLAWLAKRAWP